jgi:hypothetical protein
VLSKLALIVTAVCSPPLAGSTSAQYWGDAPNLTYPRSFGFGPQIRQQAYLQQAADEEVPAGNIASTIDVGMPPDEGYAIDESGEFMDGGSGQLPYGADALDMGGESLIPDGYWNMRGPLWYAGIAATLLEREKPGTQSTGLVVSTVQREEIVLGAGGTIQNIIAIPPAQVLSTAGLPEHFTPGMRLTIGRNLFEDILRRQHAVEFSYLGLNSWQTGGIATGPPPSAVLLSSSVVLATFGNLYSFFPVRGVGAFTVPISGTLSSITIAGPVSGGFNNAARTQIFNQSSFNNFEMNYRISCLPRADRIAQQPDGRWMQVGTPGLVYSFLGGVRVFTFNDHFQWLSNGVLPLTGHATSGLYDVKTTNALIGAQLGGDVFINFNTWSLGIRSKAGVYGNNARQSSEVQIIDPDFGNQSGANSGWSRTSAFIGDLGFVGNARLTERIYFRTSYDFLWVGGLALAPNQLQYTTHLAPTVRKNGHVLFQGISLGFDFCF